MIVLCENLPKQPAMVPQNLPNLKSSVFRSGVLIFSLVSVALGLICPRSAHAEMGNIASAPHGANGKIAYSKKSGLHISVDSLWTGRRGYRPIEYTITSAKPVTGDTQITLQFFAEGSRNSSKAIVVEQDNEIKQGSSSVTGTTLVPQYVPWSTFSWEIWVDGKKDEELTPISLTAPQSIGDGYAALFINSRNHRGYFDKYWHIQVLPYRSKSLLNDWKHYSSFDVVMVYPDDLERWRITTPEKYTQLLRWIRAGGNLWVVDVGEDYEKLEHAEKALGFKLQGQDDTDRAVASVEERGWISLPMTESPIEGVHSTLILAGLKKEIAIDDEEPLDELEEESDEPEEKVIEYSGERFVARGYGMGSIAAFPHLFGKTHRDSEKTIEAVDQTLLGQRVDWVNRHGNDPNKGNYEYGKFLIPDVGTAPVIEFQLLISLFVILIGPLNYWLLRRRHQLPLMLLTVPVAAFSMTAILFAYGFLSDGIGVRVRVRSLTTIDQQLGEAVSWARLSYYAGLAPSKGLTYPNDTVIYPILPARLGSERISQQEVFQERTIAWDKDQTLRRGWLGSRTPTQYLSIAACSTLKKISFATTGDQFIATNHLGTKIKLLIARDHDGNIYMGDEIEAEQTIPLETSESASIMLALRKIVTDNEPEFPPGLEMAQNARQRARRSNGNATDATQSDNLLDNSINALISPLSSGLAPGSYIAVTAKGPEVALGLDDIHESASLHLVQGSWLND